MSSDATTEAPPAKRIKLSKKDLEDLSKEDLIERWLERELWMEEALEAHQNEGQKENLELVSLRESEDKLRQQQLEATRRENLLVVRLAAKEQEMQEYANQIQELKQAQIPGSTQLRSTLLDPAVNLMFERMKRELNATKAKLEETQNELSAWKFTPDSNTGKRLMAKCRLLYQENEELGKMISSGRMAKLEGDLALQKNFSEEMKKSQAELDEFLLELDEDVEGMQSTILFLQQQLRESKEQIARLQVENQQLQLSASSQVSTVSVAHPCKETNMDVGNGDQRIVGTEQSVFQEAMEDTCVVANHTPVREENGNSHLPSPSPAPEENGGCSPNFKLDLEDSRTNDSAVLIIHEETMTESPSNKPPPQEATLEWTAEQSPASSKHSDTLEVMETNTPPPITTNTAEWVVIEKSDSLEGNGAPAEELVIANGTDSISPTSNDET